MTVFELLDTTVNVGNLSDTASHTCIRPLWPRNICSTYAPFSHQILALVKKVEGTNGPLSLLRLRRALFALVNVSNDCYSTVTDLARLRGLSTSVPRASAA